MGQNGLTTLPYLKCPKCGNDSWSDMRYLEDIVVYRELRRFNPKADPALVIASGYASGEGYDYGENARLECLACFKEFPLSDEVTIDFE